MSNNTIAANLELLSDKGIEFEYKLMGSKRLACVKLNNGKTVRFCPTTCKTRHSNKVFLTKSVDGFIRFMNKINNVNTD